MTDQRKHSASIFALEDFLAQRLLSDLRPVPMPQVLAMGKDAGFTPSTTRYALHRLARRGAVVFTADPTAVTVQGVAS